MNDRARNDYDAGAPEPAPRADAPNPLRKAAILLVSLEQPLASKLLAQLDRATIETVTLEIARLDRLDRAEQEAVLEEFHGLGVRRLRFGFDDVVRLSAADLDTAFADEDAATWALALAGSAPSTQARVLEALDPAASRRLRDELARVGTFRLTDAESAQAEITDRLRSMHDRGLVALPSPVGPESVLA